MSRIGKHPVKVDSDLKVTLVDQKLTISKGNNSLTLNVHPSILVEHKDGQIAVSIKDTTLDKARAFWGLTQRLITNMVTGLKTGFTKSLELFGTGFKAEVAGEYLRLSLGYSHDIMYQIPQGIQIKCSKPTAIEISGIDKQVVGKVASDLLSLRKVEPYKGKGVREVGKAIRRKEGKKK